MNEEQHKQFDAAEVAMMAHPAVECPVVHEFFPWGDGQVLYVRTVTFPEGALVTGHEHKTRHVWTMTRGVIEVQGPDGPEVLIAPCRGVTQPGTRRMARVHRETEFSTFHLVPAELEGKPDEIVRLVTVERHHLAGLEQPARTPRLGGAT